MSSQSIHDRANRRRRTHALVTASLVVAALAATGFVRNTAPSDSASATDYRAVAGATTAFTLHFEGVGAEGVDMIWRGELSDATPGEITLRVEHRAPEIDRAKAVWPVRVLAFVAADDPARSFAATLDGTMDWRTGTMQLAGAITEGWARGAPVEQTATLDREQLDGAGTLRVGLVAAR